MYRVFIDGAEGTTGLRIYDRLAQREDISLQRLPEAERKDAEARKVCIRESDITFLCLPDEAARESAALAEGSAVRIIDASTAHRTLAGWRYGLPELSRSRTQEIAAAERVAVPGCFATGFITLVYPLIKRALLSPDALLTCFAVTGYSGGGKRMIAQYEAPDRSPELNSPRQYALGQAHKHLREMQAVTGLTHTPLFHPIVADFPCGMLVTVPLHLQSLEKPASPDSLRELYREYYAGRPLIHVSLEAEEAPEGFLAANALADRDSMELFVTGNAERVVLSARFDNLGKGASGAAIQCMNLMLGLEETTGLVL